jgi:hypothetical protein
VVPMSWSVRRKQGCQTPILLYIQWKGSGLHKCSTTVQLLLRAGGLRVCAFCPECGMNGSVGCKADKLQSHCAGVAVWFAP